MTHHQKDTKNDDVDVVAVDGIVVVVVVVVVVDEGDDGDDDDVAVVDDRHPKLMPNLIYYAFASVMGATPRPRVDMVAIPVYLLYRCDFFFRFRKLLTRL